jgi:hypothetical protein
MALSVVANPAAAKEQKAKVAQSIAAVTAATEATTALVDELIRVTVAVDKVSAQIKRQAELKKEFAVLANEKFKDSEKAVFNGSLGSVEFSARSEVRQISDMNDLIGKLKEKIGYDGLLTLLKLTLGDCEKYLSKTELEPFIVKVPGSRSLKAVNITDPELAA